jgi:hypothetical protein
MHKVRSSQESGGRRKNFPIPKLGGISQVFMFGEESRLFFGNSVSPIFVTFVLINLPGALFNAFPLRVTQSPVTTLVHV